MTAEVMLTMCAAKSYLCSHFVDRAGADGTWAAHSVPTSAHVTTYVHTNACTPVTAACGGGQFLKCAGRDATTPLLPMESYDVKASVLALICADAGCDLFVSKNDDSGGTLFKLGTNGGASTYLRTSPAPPPPPPPGSLLWKVATEGVVYLPPLVDSTRVTQCASQWETCTCTGTAYYGRAGVSFSDMITDRYASAPSRNSIICSDAYPGVFADPLPGVVKQCFCVSSGGAPTIFIGTDADGFFRALNADGTLRWEAGPFGAVESTAAVDSFGNVYVGSNDGHLYALHHDGSPLFNFTTGGAVQAGVLVDAYGKIIFGSTDGFLYGEFSYSTLHTSFTVCGLPAPLRPRVCASPQRELSV